MQKHTNKILIFVALFCVIVNANAAGSMDLHYVSTILSDASSWQTPTIKASIQIFTILWFFDTFREGLFNHLFQVGRIQELLRFVIVRVIFFGFFSSIFLYTDFYIGVIQYLGGIGRTQLHFATGSTGGSGNITGLNAGWIWQQYTDWFTNDYTPAINDKGMSQIGEQLSMSVGSIVYLLCTCWISFLIIMLEVLVKATLFGGLILASCAGSKWTEPWWKSYLGAIVSLGIKVMMFMFLYASIQAEMTYKSGHINGAIDVWNQIINTIMCTLIITIVPSKIAGMVSSVGASDLGGQAIAGALAGMALAKNSIKGATGAVGGVKSVGKMAGKTAGATAGKIGKVLGGIGKTQSDKGSSTKAQKSSAGKAQQPMADKGDKEKFMNGDK